MAELLLHSMSNFKEIFDKILNIYQPKIIVEIGCEYAGSTIQFLEYCKKNDAKLIIIDPSPYVDVNKVLHKYTDYYTFLNERSLDGLSVIPKADLYVVDGDHNYWTVKNELIKIFDQNNPLVILHDVGFPWARRDLYYNPKDIPVEFLSEYSYVKGININNQVVDFGGFTGKGDFAFSLKANTKDVGVLTAIENFLESRTDLFYVEIPLIFGLGFIGNELIIKEKISPILEPYKINLMYEIERNRMGLYLKVLELQSKIDRLRQYKIVRVIERFIK